VALYAVFLVGLLAAAVPPLPAQTGTCQTVWPCTDPRGCPDFHIAGPLLASERESLGIRVQSFSDTDCAFLNGWVSGTGSRELLVFFTRISNLGPGAFQIGSPSANPDLFTPNSCHGHYHIKDFVDYRLWTVDGYQSWIAARAADPDACAGDVLAAQPELRAGLLVDGGKRGFCLTDFGVVGHRREGFNCKFRRDPEVYVGCDFQGLGVCRTEGYPEGVIGQWLDITGFPDGDYVLENEVNPLHTYDEPNRANNSTAVLIRRSGPFIESLGILTTP
jgi:hypothetical protein